MTFTFTHISLESQVKKILKTIELLFEKKPIRKDELFKAKLKKAIDDLRFQIRSINKNQSGIEQFHSISARNKALGLIFEIKALIEILSTTIQKELTILYQFKNDLESIRKSLIFMN